MARTAVLLAAALLFARAPAQPSGAITGTAVNVTGGALPGTTVSVRAGSIVRTAVTDPKGAFWIGGLPPGRYTAVAKLVGFEDASDEIDVTPGRTAVVRLALRPGCLGRVDYIDNGLPWVIDRSDVIVHIRIPGRDVPEACPASPWVNHCACALHGATVERVLKGEIGQSHVLRFVQDGAGARGQESPYGAGDEFIAFLRLDVNVSAFNRVSGPLYMFRVRDGRVELADRTLPGFTDRMTVAEFQKAIEAFAPPSPPSGARHTGRVTGIATDASGAPIPGATITLRWAQSERTTVTDNRGAFSFFDVPPGRYAVIASLHGFYSEPHTDVAVAPGGSATLVFMVETDCMRAADIAPDGGLGWALGESDLVAHIRIPTLVPDSACSVASHCSCTIHHASVLRVISGEPLRELRLIQEGAGYATTERPYAPGDEFIAFLKRDDKNHAFGRLSGPRYMFPVRNGRVIVTGRDLPGLKNGMTVAEFEKAIRALR